MARPVVRFMSRAAAPLRPKSVSEISERMSELIAEAMGEGGGGRRLALLELADPRIDIRRGMMRLISG